MPAAKCRICGKQLVTSEAYLVISYDKNGNKKKAYFCNKEEYDADEARKEKAAADKDRVYRLICDILGCKKIINTALWKEWATWNQVASDEAIASYLEENKTYLVGVITKLDNVEYNRIRYLSAILKNKLGDYKLKVKEEPKKAQTDLTFYDDIQTRQNKRRSLADLEDEF